MQSTKTTLAKIQDRIQTLKANSGNASLLQGYFQNAIDILKKSHEKESQSILAFKNELDFYLKGGEDNLDRFYKCKSEVLTIIAKLVI